jgi:hypothetical protein
MNPTAQDLVWNALVAPALPWMWLILLAIFALGLLAVLRDLILIWAERKVQEFVRDVVATVQYLFGNPRMSDETIRRARGLRYRNR